MSITANTLLRLGIQGAAEWGSYCPSPIMMPGWLSDTGGVATSYSQGSILTIVSTTSGEFRNPDLSAAVLPSDAAVGVLGPISPRRQDLAPLTSGTLPANALPRQKTIPASTTPDFTTFWDEGSGCLYYPFLPGQIFAAHMVTDNGAGGGGTDRVANAGNETYHTATTSFSVTITGAPAGGSQEVQYATAAGVWVLQAGGANLAHVMTLGYRMMQPLSFPGGVVNATPGTIVNTGSGDSHKNPVVTFTVLGLGSALF